MHPYPVANNPVDKDLPCRGPLDLPDTDISRYAWVAETIIVREPVQVTRVTVAVTVAAAWLFESVGTWVKGRGLHRVIGQITSG